MKRQTPSLLELVLEQNSEWARYIQVLNTYNERIFLKSKANLKDTKFASKLIYPADGKLQPYFLLKALVKQAVIDACDIAYRPVFAFVDNARIFVKHWQIVG